MRYNSLVQMEVFLETAHFNFLISVNGLQLNAVGDLKDKIINLK